MPPPRSASPRRLLYVANEDYAFLMHRLPMARAARDAGYEVHVATNVNAGAAAIAAERFVLHPIPFRRGGLSPSSALPTVRAIRAVATAIEPAVVHHSGLQSSVLGSLAALGRATPVVNAMTGLGYIFTSASWRSRLLKRGMLWLLPSLMNRAASCVLVQNPDDRDALQAMGIRADKITLIPGSGVDTDRFQPLPEPAGPITFGFAGRLLADKGIRALVAAHRMLRQQGRDDQLLIAGSPDPANPASVSADEVEAWRNQPGITLLGQIKDITELWRHCHIAVLPSHREGLPVSLLEAAACARPLISTDAPGCREIAIAGQTGLSVPVEDAAALAQAMAQLAMSPELRARYGQAARQLVEDKLSARIIGRSVVALYDRLTSAPGPRR
ncbi:MULTISPECIES: glycosyltransferase family 4 protein [unclassified Bradyrhizobium]|uniref:glycosyltransferase family 4 protein n=1 Tax=unclassified Bradyrhizobium TaxID=2631580 RepID=UPI0023429BBB|nr:MULTISPECIES: glycosyltransferase family 4 protein [unclassified Bradyrhizobium]GLH84526.1 glycosyl transferase family 1 [Bradyrhizobium sp. SSBR45R]